MNVPIWKVKFRAAFMQYLLALSMMAVAVLCRALLDPWLGDRLGFLTIYGAVPCAVWFTGWRPAMLASLIGLAACLYYFVPPRGSFSITDPPMWSASIGYVFSSGLIIFLGESVQRARRKAECHVQTLQILNQTCIALSSELELQALLQAITEAGREVSGAAFGAFFYNAKDDQGETYNLYTLSGAPRSAFESFPMPRNTGLFEPTFRESQVIRIGDVSKDDRYGKNSPFQGMPHGHLPVRSYLAASVTSASGQVIGGLFYGHPDTDVFTPDGEELLAGIAAQAAVAIDKAKLFQEVQSEMAARRESEAAMRAAKEQAEAANEAKDRFLALISHELRTPLTPALMIASENAGAHDLPEHVREDFASISRSLALEAKLIDDLLDISCVLQGKLPLQFAHHDVHPIIRHACEIACANAAGSATGVKVDLDLHEESLPVRCDPTRLQQVIWNLLLNALSHSPAEGVVMVRTRKGPGGVELTVRDMGPGFHADELETIFEAFQHSKGTPLSGRGKHPGLGLGLAIARGIVAAHGGKIWAESCGRGMGSTFTVQLPAA